MTEEAVLEVSGFIDQSVVENWLQTCITSGFDRVQSLVHSVISDGYAANQLLNQLHDAVMKTDQLDDPKKAKILDKISLADKRLMDGASEYLQLMDVSCEIIKQAC